MLRRTLLLRIGLLIAGFVGGAAVAIALLQRTVPGIARLNAEAAALLEATDATHDAVALLESAGPDRPDGPASPMVVLERCIAELGARPGMSAGDTPRGMAYQRLTRTLPDLRAAVSAGDSGPADKALTATRDAVHDLAHEVRASVAAEQTAIGRSLRHLVTALSVAALAMVSVAIFVLLRTARVILRPVGALVEGSRELAAEHFEHRVRVDLRDEFGELARAHNRLAEQLSAHEERKTEALRLLAVALNHDLNNALATMEMQLSLLDRQSGRDANLAKHTRDLQTTLRGMSARVASLKNIRRVVLTEYADGQKMVDLERSTTPAPPFAGAAGTPEPTFRPGR